eukprot:2884023-Pyramimonas_sp.AAC.1
MVINVTDSAFDNRPDPDRSEDAPSCYRINEDHGNLYNVHCFGWQSSKIQRVVRSTLSAEAYSCADSVDALIWTRVTLAEILRAEMEAAEIVHDTCP